MATGNLVDDAHVTRHRTLLVTRTKKRYLDRVSIPAIHTAEELERLNLPNKRTELVRGQLVVREPAGFRHGDVAAEVLVTLANFVRGKNLGRVLAAETGFKLFSNPDTVRAPDVGFVRQDRIPNPLPRGFAAFALTSPSKCCHRMTGRAKSLRRLPTG